MNEWKNREVKGVIIAAGYGTRFLPATKTVPKEMLPIIDRPAIDFIVEELVQSGIEDILVVSSRRKKAMEDHLDNERELESIFHKEGNKDKLAKIDPPKANIFFVRQREMLGTGHAIYLAKSFTKDNPFVVAYPDDIFFTKKRPMAGQLIDLFRKTGKNVLSIKDMGNEDISRYGVLDGEKSEGYFKVKSIVEKPAKGTEPSSFVSFGRYLFTPEFFDILEPFVKAHQKGELFQTEPINVLAKQGKVVGLEYEGERFDTGVPLGFFKTIVKYGLEREDLKSDIKEYLKKICKEL